MNPFSILNIKPTSDKMAIRRAYVRETKKHHPDVGGDVNHFKSIQTAYDSLISGNWGRGPLKTEVRVDLDKLLTGCIATAMLIDEKGRSNIIEFKIPAYTYPGDVIEFYDDLTARVVHVTLLEIPTSDWKRLESNIVITRKINILEAETGIDIFVKNFDGVTYTVNIPPQTSADRLIYHKNDAGFFKKKTHTRGNLNIIIEVIKESL